MFLKTPRASTDQRVRSLLQKAARRGYTRVVEQTLQYLDSTGDKAWLRSRSVVITFEECWPLAALLAIGSELSSKRAALVRVAGAAKRKDAAGLGALAYAYQQGDESTLSCVPDRYVLKLVSEALKRPQDFFEWILSKSTAQQATDAIRSAQRYLSVATWQWDKACILAGAWLATVEDMTTCGADVPTDEFPYWVALDKHTPQGKAALADVARQVGAPYRQIIWASFYFESARVNRLLPSLWWEAERTWRLGRAGLSTSDAEDLWSRAQPLVRQLLENEATALRKVIETSPPQYSLPIHESDPRG